ncbi:hypothetical protein IKG07_01645 [Candidatus Saccharibacteria bacterium]|nr:hypothetical protein [Candidatus Saccharibacteria bacterium]
MLKVVQNLRNMTSIYIYIYIGCASLSLISCFLGSSSVFAETVDYSVTIEPALTLTIPSNPIIINLDPASKTFDSKDFTVSVGTNNKTGYTLTLSTPNDSTNLNRDTASDGISAIMPTLDPGTYTESSFTADKWGYKINSNTSIPSTITSGFVPFVSGNTLMESDTAVNHDEAELSLAAKIDYLQASGSYSTTLNFNLVAHPLVNYMQDLDPNLCTTTPQTVLDRRDSKEYTIARLADGQCWMISDLNLAGGTVLNADTSDVPTDNYFTLPASSTSGFISDTVAYVYNSGNETTNQADCTSTQPCNSYYSWLTATAGGKDASGTAVTGNGYNAAYSICPKGWRLPTATTSNAPAQTSPNWKTGDFYKLATAYGANLESASSQSSPVFYNNAGPGTTPNFLQAGVYNNNAFQSGGSLGYYLSSSSYSSTQFYYLYFSSSAVYSAHILYRRIGFPVRCILDETMQNFADDLMSVGDTRTLRDTRDNQTYTIAKLPDNNIWMTRNLAIGCNGTGPAYGSSNIARTLTSSDTNISAQSWNLPTTTFSNNISLSEPRVACNATYGGYYNYSAASALSIIGDVNLVPEAPEDICPSGWKMPSYTDINGIMSYATQFTPTKGGRYYNSYQNGNFAAYWTSSLYTPLPDTRRYELRYDGTLFEQFDERQYGYFVRCIAK